MRREKRSHPRGQRDPSLPPKDILPAKPLSGPEKGAPDRSLSSGLLLWARESWPEPQPLPLPRRPHWRAQHWTPVSPKRPLRSPTSLWSPGEGAPEGPEEAAGRRVKAAGEGRTPPGPSISPSPGGAGLRGSLSLHNIQYPSQNHTMEEAGSRRC